MTRLPAAILLLVFVALLSATNAQAGGRSASGSSRHPLDGRALVRPARPPLPRPMPQIFRGECPGLPDADCYVGPELGVADGRVFAQGAVFTRGDRYATMHELGHAFDATLMDYGERERFSHLVDRFDEVWSDTYTDEEGRLIQHPDSIAEVFADAYANCRLGHVVASGHIWEAGYDYYPTARQHRRICGMITRAGEDLGTHLAADGSR